MKKAMGSVYDKGAALGLTRFDYSMMQKFLMDSDTLPLFPEEIMEALIYIHDSKECMEKMSELWERASLKDGIFTLELDREEELRKDSIHKKHIVTIDLLQKEWTLTIGEEKTVKLQMMPYSIIDHVFYQNIIEKIGDITEKAYPWALALRFGRPFAARLEEAFRYIPIEDRKIIAERARKLMIIPGYILKKIEVSKSGNVTVKVMRKYGEDRVHAFALREAGSSPSRTMAQVQLMASSLIMDIFFDHFGIWGNRGEAIHKEGTEKKEKKCCGKGCKKCKTRPRKEDSKKKIERVELKRDGEVSLTVEVPQASIETSQQ